MGLRYWDWRLWLRGTPLMSAQADINQRGSEGMGISNPCRVACNLRTIGHRADERKPSFLAQARKNDELRAKSEAICSWWEEQGAKRQRDGRPLRICSVEQYQITNALNLSESTYDGNLKMVSNRVK